MANTYAITQETLATGARVIRVAVTGGRPPNGTQNYDYVPGTVEIIPGIEVRDAQGNEQGLTIYVNGEKRHVIQDPATQVTTPANTGNEDLLGQLDFISSPQVPFAVPGTNEIFQRLSLNNDDVNFEMNVDGSISTRTFTFQATERMLVTKISTFMEDDAPFASGNFGGLLALANGVRVTVQNMTSFVLQTNRDFFLCYDEILFASFAPPNDFIEAKLLYTPIILDVGDQINFLIQDNLVGLTSFQTKVRGYLI